MSWMGWNEAQAQQLQTDGEKQAEASGARFDPAQLKKDSDAEFATLTLSERKHAFPQPLGAKRKGPSTEAAPTISPDLNKYSILQPNEEQSTERIDVKPSANRAGHSITSGPLSLETPGMLATNPEPFVPQWQRLDTAPSGSISSIPPDEQDEFSVNTKPETVIAAEVESQDEYEARVRRDVEARLHSQVQAEVQRILWQSTVPAENVVALDVAPVDYEANEEILEDDDRSNVGGHHENHLKPCGRSPATFIYMLLIVVVVICVGITAAILLSRNNGTAPSAESDAGPLSPSPTSSPVPATIAPTESPVTELPMTTPTDTPTNALTNPPTGTDPPTLVTPALPNGPWEQLGQDVDGKFAGEHSGWSVLLSKDASIMAIGAPGYENSVSIPGYVRMYRYSSATTTWQQLGQELVGESDLDQFGFSVKLNHAGDIVAIGAHQFWRNGPGYVRVYQYNSSTSRWSQLDQELTGESIGDQFGWAVALSSTGYVLATASDKNAAQIYEYNTATTIWRQRGHDLFGIATLDQFAISLVLNSEGDVIAIGANQYDNNGAGYVHVYQYSPTTSEWIQMGQELFGESEGDFFGESVSLSAAGDILAVASPGNDAIGNDTGCVHVYQYSSATSNWNQLGQKLDGEEAYDYFGRSVSLSSAGNVLAVVANRGGNDNGIGSGQVKIYKYSTATSSWTQIGSDIDGEAAYDWSGWSVSLNVNGTLVAIGAPLNDDNGEDSGHARVYTLDETRLH